MKRAGVQGIDTWLGSLKALMSAGMEVVDAVRQKLHTFRRQSQSHGHQSIALLLIHCVCVWTYEISTAALTAS